MRKVIAILLTAISLYVAFAGWVKIDFDEYSEKSKATADKPSAEGGGKSIIYEGITFNSQADVEKYQHYESVMWFCRWVFDLPSPAGLMLSALSFGFTGGAIKVGLQVCKPEAGVTPKFLEWPMLGALTGLPVLGLSYAVPHLLTTGDCDLRPTALLAICLLAGIFPVEFYTLLKKMFKSAVESF